MEHQKVKSSSVESIAYDPQSKELHVKYHGSGKTYAYSGVAYDQHFKLMNSQSKGKYVANVIQKNHKATLVK